MKRESETNAITLAVDDEAASLATMTDEQLDDEFRTCLRVGEHQFVRMAAIIRIQEERGRDMSQFRFGLFFVLRRLAHGLVLPEMVTYLQGRPTLLRRLSQLPKVDQEKLMKERQVNVVEIVDGDVKARLIPLLQLSGRQVNQAIAPDHLRDKQEQVVLIKNRQSRDRELAGDSGIVVGQKRLRIGGTWYSTKLLQQMIERSESR